MSAQHLITFYVESKKITSYILIEVEIESCSFLQNLFVSTSYKLYDFAD